MTNVIVLLNIAALRTYSGGSSAPSIWIEGYSTAGDGGEGMFTYVSTDTSSTDNGGTIILDNSSNRYYRENHLGPYNILWFGGHTNGTTDNTTALNAALAALPNGGGQIFFPPGKYYFGSQITYNMPAGLFSAAFVGAATDASVLYWPSTSGIKINASSSYHSVHFRDLSITTLSKALYTGVMIYNSVLLTSSTLAQSNFTRITFRANDSSLSYGWYFSILVEGFSNVYYDQITIYGYLSGTGPEGIGIQVEGNAAISPYTSLGHNFTNCEIFYTGTAVVYGSFVQGVTFSQCVFNLNNTGIYVPPLTGTGDALAELSVIACEFNCYFNQIEISAPLAGLFVSSSLFYIFENYSGIVVGGSTAFINQTSISNNGFGSPSSPYTNTYGINIDGAATTDSLGSVITGNSFTSLNIGVFLGANTTYFNVQANVYFPVNTPVVNNGSGNSIGVATP